MSQQALWLSVSSTLKRFHRPLIKYLSRQQSIQQWEYHQHEDEPATLDVPVTLLHDYLKNQPSPIHLLGHSTGGIVGLLYAYRYPERVKSLTLLGVGVHPLIDWHAHYYANRQMLPCSQEIVLGQMVRSLFGYQDQIRTKRLAHLLENDLKTTPSPHSLMQRSSLESKGILSPLMVCGSENDVIVDPCALAGWKNYLKPEDQIWKCSQGNHFFHYHDPQLVGDAILEFYEELDSSKSKAKATRSRLIN